MSARRTLLLALPVALWLASCSATVRQADRSFARGDYPAAAAGYGRLLEGGGGGPAVRARCRLRLGLAYALPDSPLHEPLVAERLLRQVAADPAAGVWAREAAAVLAVLEEARGLRTDVDRRSADVSSLTRKLAALREDAASAAGEQAGREDQLDAMRRRLAALEAEIRALSAALADRQEELRRLKEIDLRPPP